jgi:hypothetical protein
VTPVNLWSDLFLLLRVAAAGTILWLLPWRRVAAFWFPGIVGAGRVALGFSLGVFATVISNYLLAIAGLYTPLWGLLLYLIISFCAWVSIPARVSGSSQQKAESGVPWVLSLAALLSLLIRLPDPLSHEALGGNDPWGHLVLCKALAQGDLLASFHFFGYYPRGYHFLVLVLARLTGGSIYDVMRLSGPLLSLVGVVGAYAIGKRVSSSTGGLLAAFVYAIPPYQHLVLPALQTALEPDRFSFVLLPSFILILAENGEGVSRSRKGTFLLIGGISLLLIHPLSVQFLVGWMLLAGIALIAISRNWKGAATTVAPAFVVLLFSWAYYRVMHSVYGVTPMPHIAPEGVVTIGGHGVDLHRLVFGTGLHAQAADIVALTLVTLLALWAVRRRSPELMLISLVLLHTLYAALSDALYIGDFGHAPPYYSMAFAWAAGAALGSREFGRWLRFMPLFLLGGVLISSPFSSHGSVWVKISLMVLLAAMSLMSLLRHRYVRVLVPVAVGTAFLAVRPIPVSYPHLGYPEGIRWARNLLSCQKGTVYSQGLISRLPSGMPFPTQDPIASIVWPVHKPEALHRLTAAPPDERLEAGEHGYVFVEREPYRWSFPYFEKAERTEVFRSAQEWLSARRAAGAPITVLAQTERMVLLALHEGEAGECRPFQ